MEEIFIRRSVRKYIDQPVGNEKIDKLLRAAMQAPSAGNQQPWEFIVVQEKENLIYLSKMFTYARLLESSPLAIILLGNTERMSYPNCWEQDMGAATQNILLEAVSLGLGAVWIGVTPYTRRMNYISSHFNLNENLKPYSIVSIGYPFFKNANKFRDRYDEKKVHYEKY
jgi:nitroreductase